MDKNIKQVMAVEKTVEKIGIDAEKKASVIIENARQDAIDLKTELEQKILKKRTERQKSTEQDMAKKKEILLKTAQKENEQLGNKGQKNMDKAVDYVLDLLKQVD